LDYWKSVSTRFPVLSLMARRFLAIPATSAPVKRVFSISRNIVSKGRNRIAPETTKRMVLLKSWNIKESRELEENFRNSAIIEEG